MRAAFFSKVLWVGVFSAACSSSSANSSADPAAGAGGAGSTSAGGSGAGSGSASGGTGTSACATSCDDGFGCTVDSCVSGTCMHSIGPAMGSTACPSGHYCTADKGCVQSPACSSDTQCVDAFKSDACKMHVMCEAASSVCTFDVLDKDNDGHAPVICGGDDCNDDDANIYPGATELCNGKDDNCNGVIDEVGTTCNDDGGIWIGATCVGAKCDCVAPKVKCVTGTAQLLCTDWTQDPQHCGDCAKACDPGQACVNSKCM